MATDVSLLEPAGTIVKRKGLLTNEPAEFVENGAAFRLLFELANSNEEFKDLRNLENISEYAPDLDRFVPKEAVISASRYYQESKKRKLGFERRLQAFATMLKDRNVDKELHIEIKDPKDFDLPYVLNTIDKIQKNAEKGRPYKNFFKKCFCRIEDNRDLMEGILSFVPDDVYGSIISGGFTLILAYVEKHAEEREATEKFLVEIQDRLGGIQRLRYVHRRSHRVHSCADAVVVSVFNVLERIMEKITKKWQGNLIDPLKVAGSKAKGFFSGSFGTRPRKENHNTVSTPSAELNAGKGQSIPDALKELQSCVEKFQKEVDVAVIEMIGSTNEDVQVMKQAAVWMAKSFGDSMKRTQSVEDMLIAIQNTLCLVLKSDSFINNRTAQVDHKEMEQSRLEQVARSERRLQKNNNRVTSEWLSSLKGFDYDPMTDIKDCIEHIEKLDRNAKNVSEQIMSSEELSDWLQDTESGFLMVSLEPPPSDLNNPLSFTSALLAMTLRSTQRFPVLAFFCMHRNNEFAAEEKSGPVAMVKSLNGQLLEFMNRNRIASNVSQLENKGFFSSSSRKKLEQGLSLLQALLSLLPAGDTVFIILDSLSCLSGKEESGRKLIKCLDRIIKSQTDISIRVLATDPLVDSPLRKIAQWRLHILDSVSGAGIIETDDATQRIRKGLVDSHDNGNQGGAEDSEDDEDESDEEQKDDSSDDNSDNNSDNNNNDDDDDDDDNNNNSSDDNSDGSSD